MSVSGLNFILDPVKEGSVLKLSKELRGLAALPKIRIFSKRCDVIISNVIHL